MSQSQSSSASGGIGLTGILLAAFIILKLTGYTVVASWSWVKVLLLPFAIGIGLFLFWVLVALVFAAFVALVAALFGR